eukprot:TRINITY_DN12280_c0_g1_i1.p1 TRINITY_DN12280_c0_g1~~TRINITY_DN12280_c0_g1_i1.p1  ORF type:complete len:496 (+),score=168.56 TRINITY_DN12280_c0_g1_i1:79-1566(+)
MTASSVPRSPSKGCRPYPWGLVTDEAFLAAGVAILGAIVVPTLSLILISTFSGFALSWALYEYNPPMRWVLDRCRDAIRAASMKLGDAILLDPRNHSYLPWMLWGLVVNPAMFYWVWTRYNAHGLEIATFLVYHAVRLGPRYRFFAHHETLIHKEGHAVREGLFRNVLNTAERAPIPRPLRRAVFDHINGGLIGVFYGSIPYHYATAHNKIHHRWHNDTGDVHTNMDLDRTAFSSYVMWLPRFVLYWTGVSPALLFWKRDEAQYLRDILGGMAYYYGIGALVWYAMGPVFFWAYYLYPHLEAASFLGAIAYIWHAFSDEADPSNQYVNSITILRGQDNIWNEDFHVVHHHEPFVHWTDMPKSFDAHKEEYTRCRATVFADCEEGQIIAWMFGADWDGMANHFVDLQYVFSNGDRNADKLMTVRDVAKVEAALGGAAPGAHHADVKALLLKRLKYHYMGTREGEWERFHQTMAAGVRVFDHDEDTKAPTGGLRQRK